MNRTPNELTDALAFAIVNGGVSTVLVGDNELSRLIVDWREKSDEIKLLQEIVRLVNRGSRMAMPPDLVAALDAVAPPSGNGSEKS